MIVGGLIVWCLERIRDVLVEAQRTQRDALELEATMDDLPAEPEPKKPTHTRDHDV